MRGIGALIAGFVGLVALVAAGLFLFRGPIAAHFIRGAMVNAGLADPKVSVKELTLSRIVLADLRAGDGLAVERVGAAYDWRTILNARRVEALEVGPGAVTIVMAPDGGLSLAGMKVPPEGEGGPLPFTSLTVTDLGLTLRTPRGDARGKASGDFAPETGGAFDLEIEASAIGAGDVAVSDLAIDADVQLAPDGRIVIAAEAAGDLESAFGAARGVALKLEGAGSSWRDALEGRAGDVAGAATIDLQSAEMDVAEAPALAALSSAEPPVETLSLSGRLGVELGGGGLTLRAPAEPALRVLTDRGDTLLIAADGDAPLFDSDGESRRAALVARLSGLKAAEARVSAERSGASPWRFSGNATAPAQTLFGVTLGATAIGAEGEASTDSVTALVDLDTTIARIAAGETIIEDAPVSSRIDFAADLDARAVTLAGADGACIDIARMRLTLAGGAAARLREATLCGKEAPLIASSWAPGAVTRVIGRLTAKDATYRVGETNLDGAPPSVDFEVDAEGAKIAIAGAFSGGRVKMNEAFIIADSAGGFSSEIGPSGLVAEAHLERARLSQHVEPPRAPQIAPLNASANVRVEGDRATFDYAASTTSGAALGGGAGVHDLKSGRGETTFSSGDLFFSPSGLQPAGIALGLTGIVSGATGGATLEASFAWGPPPQVLRSSGVIDLRNLTFRGPGVLVSQTGGVTGRIALSSLAPVKSDGPQSLQIGLIDLNALKLEKGAVEFEFPGDETLRISRGEFPWFGGVLGIYDATASLAGDSGDIPLRAEKVDLAQILKFVDVDGLTGEGILSGVLPLVIEGGKARIVNGELRSEGPGAVRYVGQGTDTAAAAAGAGAEVAFSILRDLRFSALVVRIDGALDGVIDFKTEFVGTGDVPYGSSSARLPVRYTINLEAALLELLNQVNVTRDLQLQIERAEVAEQ